MKIGVISDTHGVLREKVKEILRSCDYIIHAGDIGSEDIVHILKYGHSHKYSEENKEGIIYLNPGSCGRKRFSLPLTMAVININVDNIEIEKINIEG